MTNTEPTPAPAVECSVSRTGQHLFVDGHDAEYQICYYCGARRR